MPGKIVVFWFRRDLRLNDNHGLSEALDSGFSVLPVFIFDPRIITRLPAADDPRITFIYETLAALKTTLEAEGHSLKIFHLPPLDAFKALVRDYEIAAVCTNRDYEPFTKDRDRGVQDFLEMQGIAFHAFKDHVLFDRDEVVKDNGQPYTVYTPYSKKWKKMFAERPVVTFPSEQKRAAFLQTVPFSFPSLTDLGFSKSFLAFPAPEISEDQIRNYPATRNFPAQRGTTRLGVHLRFGTVSIRGLALKAKEWSEVFLDELIWRDFFISILHHFPYVAEKSFRTKYDRLEWQNDEKDFHRWSRGETGFPLVDAGMRELNETGFMHNRVRMVAAGFLTKHLLIDWRWGEAYFAEKLLDYELASNNGNWQWAAGTGCDAAPWFRIFNPVTQQKKFDPQGEYVKKWVPEAGTMDYPPPLVDHKMARERALQRYKLATRG